VPPRFEMTGYGYLLISRNKLHMNPCPIGAVLPYCQTNNDNIRGVNRPTVSCISRLLQLDQPNRSAV